MSALSDAVNDAREVAWDFECYTDHHGLGVAAATESFAVEMQKAINRIVEVWEK